MSYVAYTVPNMQNSIPELIRDLYEIFDIGSANFYCSSKICSEAQSILILNQTEDWHFIHIGNEYDAVIVAVAHDEYKQLSADYFRSIMNKNPILIDLKNLYGNFNNTEIERWSL